MSLDLINSTIDTARKEPLKNGAALILVALLLKMTTVIKIISLCLLTLGVMLIWEYVRSKSAEAQSSD